MTIGIVGMGRFGSLLKQHLESDNEVFGFEKSDDKSDLQQCELIILSIPNNSLQQAVEEIKQFVSDKAIVMDTGSIKVKPCEILQASFKNNILGTHPLFGPDSAGDSWQDHKMVFCKLNIEDDKYNKVKELFTIRGVKAIECTPQEHDQMMAKTQALVHFIGRALDGLEPDYANLLHMMEKVTNDTKELFFDMQNLNPYAEEVRQDFINKINQLDIAIKDDQSNR